MNAHFFPVAIGGVEVPNRVIMPPMTTRLADPEGYVTDALVAYYEARALGGVGLITVEMGSPEKVGRHRYRELGVYDDRISARARVPRQRPARRRRPGLRPARPRW